ncbi:MAG: LamG-like jellyroll fold domain-containing protein [Ilumatobacteraceae bacterium]
MRPLARATTSGGTGVTRERLAMWYDPSNSACWSGSGTQLATLYEDDRVDPEYPGNNFSGTFASNVIQTVGGQTSFKCSGGSDARCQTYIPFQQDWWLDCWLYFDPNEGFGNIFGTGTTATSQGLHILLTGSGFSTLRFGMYSNDTDFTHGMTTGWNHLAFSYLDSSPYTKRTWVNGVEVAGTPLQTQQRWGNSNRLNLFIGKSYGNPYQATTTYGTMGIAVARHYLGATANDAVVLRNYSAERVRFGR